MCIRDSPESLRGLMVLCDNGEMSVLGVFLPEKGKNQSSIYPLLDWINEDPNKLADRPTVLTGDFNHGVLASTWNRGKAGAQYNLLSKRIEGSVWDDCCPTPDPDSQYEYTFQHSKTAQPLPGQRWPKGSSRPDHFFVSKLVSFKNISVLSGQIREGISDHEPMVGDFCPASGT